VVQQTQQVRATENSILRSGSAAHRLVLCGQEVCTESWERVA
jgi:hypothetical protein